MNVLLLILAVIGFTTLVVLAVMAVAFVNAKIYSINRSERMVNELQTAKRELSHRISSLECHVSKLKEPRK